MWADEGSTNRGRRVASSRSFAGGASSSWRTGRTYDSSRRIGCKRGPYKKFSQGSAFSVSSTAGRDSLPWAHMPECPEAPSVSCTRTHETDFVSNVQNRDAQRWFKGLDHAMEEQHGSSSKRALNWLDALKDVVEAQVLPRARNFARRKQDCRLRVLAVYCVRIRARAHARTHTGTGHGSCDPYRRSRRPSQPENAAEGECQGLRCPRHGRGVVASGFGSKG